MISDCTIYSDVERNTNAIWILVKSVILKNYDYYYFMRTIFRVFIEFVTILFLLLMFCISAIRHVTLSSLTMD